MYRKKSRNGYMYLICRFCKSSISMKQEETVRFVKYDNHHYHNGHAPKREEESRVMRFLVGQLDAHTV